MFSVLFQNLGTKSKKKFCWRKKMKAASFISLKTEIQKKKLAAAINIFEFF